MVCSLYERRSMHLTWDLQQKSCSINRCSLSFLLFGVQWAPPAVSSYSSPKTVNYTSFTSLSLDPPGTLGWIRMNSLAMNGKMVGRKEGPRISRPAKTCSPCDQSKFFCRRSSYLILSLQSNAQISLKVCLPRLPSPIPHPIVFPKTTSLI